MRLFREIILSTLILIIILLTMGIILYDKLPALKKIPKAQEYSKSLEAQKILDEVVNQEEVKTAIKTYTMNKSEMRALSRSSRFEKGKNNPFADYSTKPGTYNPNGSSGKIFDDPDDGVSK